MLASWIDDKFYLLFYLFFLSTSKVVPKLKVALQKFWKINVSISTNLWMIEIVNEIFWDTYNSLGF